MITPSYQPKKRPQKGGIRGLRELRELKKHRSIMNLTTSNISNPPTPRFKESALFSLQAISDQVTPVLQPHFFLPERLIGYLEEMAESPYEKMNSVFQEICLERLMFVFQASVGELFCEAVMKEEFLGSEVVEKITQEFVILSKVEDLQTVGEKCILSFNNILI